MMDLGTINGVSYSAKRSKNKITVNFAGKVRHQPGWGNLTSGGRLCDILALPGGTLVLGQFGQPMRIFPEGDEGAEAAIRWAIQENGK
jgi:hypothetical protein